MHALTGYSTGCDYSDIIITHACSHGHNWLCCAVHISHMRGVHGLKIELVKWRQSYSCFDHMMYPDLAEHLNLLPPTASLAFKAPTFVSV